MKLKPAESTQLKIIIQAYYHSNSIFLCWQVGSIKLHTRKRIRFIPLCELKKLVKLIRHFMPTFRFWTPYFLKDHRRAVSSVSLNIFPELLSNEETTLQKISLPLLTQCTITIRTYERYLFQLAEWFSHRALLDRGGPHVSSSGPDPYSRTFVYLLRSYY